MWQWVLVSLAVVVIGWLVVSYNALVRLRVQLSNAWSQIEVELKRRYNLIPNLVEIVKGYASHERETLERVVQARNAAAGTSGVKAQSGAENILTGALKSLFALAEAYPDLKANQNFLSLQTELAAAEDQISVSRQAYNNAVSRLNTAVQSFPSNIVAGIFRFTDAEFFELDETEAAEARKVPKVEF